MSTTLELFPETQQQPVAPVEFHSDHLRDKWGHPRITVRLTSQWSEQTGLWTVGWFCLVDRAVDEWLPGGSVTPNWPWYRPNEQPTSTRYAIACASAGRAVKIVIEQMLSTVETPEVVTAAQEIQNRIEDQARRWLIDVDRG